jgi:type II secretory pathway predicted ATPase ExeA
MTPGDGAEPGYPNWIEAATDDQRILFARADKWVNYPRAAAVLDRMNELVAWPRNSRMPSLLVVGESGIGKTQIVRRFATLHPEQFDESAQHLARPVVVIQMQSTPSDRTFYMALLHAIGAVHGPRIATADAMFMAVRLYREIGVRVIVFDEAHNMLAGSFREQRRVLTQLRWFSNELSISLVCLGIDTAREALAADTQLARRFGMIQLAPWTPDADFRGLIATIIRHLPLVAPSVLDTPALQAIIRVTRGNTARIFEMMADLTVRAIVSGAECIRPEAIEHWQPSLREQSLVA